MVKIHNLIDRFNRELEILEVNDEGIICVLDQKSDKGNRCAIARYDFASGALTTLLELEGTRLYESFGTFGAVKDYFYAVTIGGDYKLRLQEIDRTSWKIRRTFYLVPEGEVLNLYPVNEDYLIVTDEVMATDELLEKFQDEDYEGKYYTLTYLYHLKTGEKWYLQPSFGHLEVVDVQSCPLSHGRHQVIFQLQQSDRDGEGKGELRAISDSDLTAALEKSQEIPFIKIEDAADGHTINRMLSDAFIYRYRVHDNEKNQDTVYVLKPEDDSVVRECRAVIDLPEDGEIVYGVEDASVYHVVTDEDGRVRVDDLINGKALFDYDSAYGDFTGICTKDLAVTSFYRSQMQKGDMVFKECVALHRFDDGSVEVFDGRCRQQGSHLILLRSFLCL